MKILLGITTFLLAVIVVGYIYFDNIIAQKDREINNIRTEIINLPDNYEVVPVTQDSLLMKQLLDSLKKTVKPKIIEKIRIETDSSEIESLKKIIAFLEEKEKQYKDSLLMYVDYADTVVSVDVPCYLEVGFWGKPFNLFTFNSIKRIQKKTVKPEFIKPDKQYVVGVNLGSYYDGTVLFGVSGQMFMDTWGLGADICNQSSNLKVLKSFDFYKK